MATEEALIPEPGLRNKRRRNGDVAQVSSSDSDSDSTSSSSSSSGSTSGPDESVKLESGRTLETQMRKATAKLEETSPSVKVESSSSSDSDSSSGEDEDSELSDLSGEEDVDVEVVETEAGDFKDLMSQLPPVPLDTSYRGNWSGAPSVGSRGFNAFATKAMRVAGVASRPLDAQVDQSLSCPPLQPHQEVVTFLLHPQSPVSRLLIDHPTGSGKTREMISVLDNYFHDPRPKVPIFPKEPVCQNFYSELLRWPSSYRDFFSCLRPEDAARACGEHDWRNRRHYAWVVSDLPDQDLRRICNNMRDVLEMKGWYFMGRMKRSRRDAFERRFPNEKVMAAPLRALRYTSAGGRHTELRNGLPLSALLKVAFDHKGKNVYSNKIVIMDEVHNLVRNQTQFGEQLARLRELLLGAGGAVLAGFTGTPILSERSEGKQLLDIIKGHCNGNARDQGFLSSFPMRPQPLFARALPLGVPDAILTPKLRRKIVQRTRLKGESLKRYDIKRSNSLPMHRLQRYCNMSTHFGSFHDGKNSCKAKVLGNFEAYAPKLYAIASAVAASTQKSLVLVARNSGMDALLAHLREVAKRSRPPFKVATMEEIAAFNSVGNKRGEMYRVLVADALTCSEGVSFFCVRRLHLADVPATPSAFVQAVGRAIRMYGHQGLPVEEQTLTTILHIAHLPSWMRSPLGVWALRAQRKRSEPGVMEKQAMHILRQLRKAGITDLDALKKRIEEIAAGRASKSTGTKVEDFESKLNSLKPDLAKSSSDKKEDEVQVKKEPVEEKEEQVEVKEEPMEEKEEPMEEKEEPIEEKDELVEKKVEPEKKDEIVPKVKIQEDELTSEKKPLDTNQIAAILEHFGMWEEAKAVRLRLERSNKSKNAPAKKKSAGPKSAMGLASRPLATPLRSRFLKTGKFWSAARITTSKSTPSEKTEINGDDMPLADLKNKVSSPTKAKVEKTSPSKRDATQGIDVKTEDMSLADFARHVKKEEKHGKDIKITPTSPTANQTNETCERTISIDRYWRRDPLALAIQSLYLERSTDDAIQRMRFSPLTADEQALRQLSSRSREFVPALTELRSKAIDRSVLQQYAAQSEDGSSEGETSECEFAISGSDREGAARKDSNFLLPPGWRTEKFRRQSREVREYVDPDGRRYRTMAEARQAVNIARARENMNQRMRSKYGVTAEGNVIGHAK